MCTPSSDKHTHILPKHRRQHGTAGGKDRRCAVHLRAALTRPPRAVSPRSCHCRPRRGKAVTECILRQVEKLDTPQICPFFLNNFQPNVVLIIENSEATTVLHMRCRLEREWLPPWHRSGIKNHQDKQVDLGHLGLQNGVKSRGCAQSSSLSVQSIG